MNDEVNDDDEERALPFALPLAMEAAEAGEESATLGELWEPNRGGGAVMMIGGGATHSAPATPIERKPGCGSSE